MEKSKPYKKQLLFSFLFIVLLNAAGNLALLGNSDYLRDKVFIWYGLQALWFFALVFAGYIGWKNHPQKWLKHVWLGIYIIGCLSFCIFGFIDFFITKFQYTARKDISQIRVFFLSPIPFVILYFLERITNKGSKQSSSGDRAKIDI